MEINPGVKNRGVNMQYEHNRSWMDISFDNLNHNFNVIKDLVGPLCDVICMVKGNAYGHGAIMISKELEKAGCKYLGVATVEEAMELRRNHIGIPVIVFGPVNTNQVGIAAGNGISVSVYNYNQAAAMSDAISDHTLNVHLAIDTGLSRFGIAAGKHMDTAIEETSKIFRLPHLALRGAFTHFAVAGKTSQDNFTRKQFDTFRTYIDKLAQKGIRLLYHCANSPATIRFPESRLDMVRVGGLLYGLNSFGDRIGTKPVMELKSRVCYLKVIEPGDTLSYGRLFTAKRPTKIAVIPIGYGDGLNRHCTNKAHVLINGEIAPIIGKLCMDVSFVDITDVRHKVCEGDIVTIWGTDHGKSIPISDYADIYDGSPAEVTTSIGSRIPKFYIKEGNVVGQQSLVSQAEKF